jgi:hypothetical protein
MNNQPERILLAANHYDDGKIYEDQPHGITTGIVVAGYRHSDCHLTYKALMGDRYDSKLETREGQGFLTSHKRFVSREEAFKIAKEMKQMWHTLHDDKETEILTSEDLYYGFDEKTSEE